MELCHYASDETSSESDLLDRSLSMWIGWNEDEAFEPIPLDLHTAASLGDFDCVKDILSRPNTDPDRPNRAKWTPLMYASYIGHGNIVGLLVEANVDVNVTTDDGTTALMLAASCGKDNVVALLYKNGAKLDLRNRRGWTALFCATSSGHQNMVQLLVSLGVDVHKCEYSLGLTSLMLAAAEGHEVIVSIFLEKGVDVTLKNRRGDTARSLAILNGHMNVVALIDNWNTLPSTLRADPDLSSSDENFQPPNRRYNRKSSAKTRGPSIQDGPALFAKMMSGTRDSRKHAGPSKHRAPMTPRDLNTDATDGSPFCASGAVTVRSSAGSSSSTDSLAGTLGLSREGSISSNDGDADDVTSPAINKFFHPRDFSLLGTPKTDFASHLGGLNHPQVNFRHAWADMGGSSGSPYDPAGKKWIDPQNLNFDPLIHSEQQSDDHSCQWLYQKKFGQNEKLPPRIEMPVVSGIDYTPSIPQLSISSIPNVQNETFPAMSSDQNKITPKLPIHRKKTIPPKSTNVSQELPFVCNNQKEMLATNQIVPNKILHENAQGRNKNVITAISDQNRIAPLKGGVDTPDLRSLLESLNLSKYLSVFEEQDVDLRVFLTLTDADLKEIGIKLMGPRRKMTNAIAKLHSQAVTQGTDQEYQKLHWLPILQRVDFKILVLVCKELHGLAAGYITDMIKLLIKAKERESQLQQERELTKLLIKANELESQLQQEQELRKVVEGCLVEDQMTYRRMLRLVSDTRSLCHQMRELYENVRYLQKELITRVGLKGFSENASPSPEELARSLQIGLTLECQLALFGNQFTNNTKVTNNTNPIENYTPPDSLSFTLAHSGSLQAGEENPPTSSRPITGLNRNNSHSSAIDQVLPLDARTGNCPVSIQSMTMGELVSNLSQMSHQMARVVATVTSKMDQLLEGQTKNFSTE